MRPSFLYTYTKATFFFGGGGGGGGVKYVYILSYCYSCIGVVLN